MKNRTKNTGTSVSHGTHNGWDWLTIAAPYNSAINGYIVIPKDSKWYLADYDQVMEELSEEGFSGVWFDGGAVNLTFAGEITVILNGEDTARTVYVVGFDTLHHNDLWEGGEFSSLFSMHGSDDMMFGPRTIWSLSLVEDNCRKWIDVLSR